MFTKLREWLTYTPLNEREPWEVERHRVDTPPAIWVRLL